MAKEIYETKNVYLLDGTELEVSPLKIKYLKPFMETFASVKDTETDDEAIVYLVECVRIAMKQFCPSIKTKDDVEDAMDMATLYDILEICGGIKIRSEGTAPKEEAAPAPAGGKNSESTWDGMDFPKLEAEAFMLGIWQNYDELEKNLSMPELILTLETKREADWQNRKFLASLQGVDLEGAQGGTSNVDPWEAMKARVDSGGKTSDPNDILSFQGAKAAKMGFGIGMGIEYETA